MTLFRIKTNKVGIDAVIRPFNFKYLPRNNAQQKAWAEILDAQYFRYPDVESIEMAGLDGIRLLTKDGKIVIYRNIVNYEKLLDDIRSHVEITEIPPEMKRECD